MYELLHISNLYSPKQNRYGPEQYVLVQVVNVY